MTRYIARRAALLILTVFLTTVIIFTLTQLLPGDIARLQLGRDASAAEVEAFREERGLNDPAPIQYVNWLTRFVAGDWGRSFSSGSPPVRPLVLERFGNSLRLGAFTLVIAVPLSLLLGVVAALNANRWPDGLISVLSLSVVGLPEFVTGIALVNLLAFGANLFPPTSLIPSGATFGDWLRILTLPAITAAFVIIGYITRLTRAAVVEEMRKPYVMMAELKGLPRRQVIVKHVLRNALMPSITVIALSVGWLIGGLVVVENVFNFPGMGALLVTAVEQKNIPVIQSVAVLIIVALALANLLADLLYAALNPRVRLGG